MEAQNLVMNQVQGHSMLYFDLPVIMFWETCEPNPNLFRQVLANSSKFLTDMSRQSFSENSFNIFIINRGDMLKCSPITLTLRQILSTC